MDRLADANPAPLISSAMESTGRHPHRSRTVTDRQLMNDTETA
jgi:hypothetical protein